MGKETSSTLVLNKSWMAVQVCSVKRAIGLLYQGHAKVVGEDYQVYNFDDWSEVSRRMVEVNSEEFITSPLLSLRIPRVIVLLYYDKLPKATLKFSRKNILQRDKFTCQYCGKGPSGYKTSSKWMEKNELSLDHVVPRCRGGKTTWQNIVACCLECNTKKGSRSLQELGWKLDKTPKAPKYHPTVNISLRSSVHKQWVNFVDIAYWNVELENDNLS